MASEWMFHSGDHDHAEPTFRREEEDMKFIVTRSGSYTETTYVEQLVEVEAECLEDATDFAWCEVDDEGVRLLSGDPDGWDYCDDAYVEDVIDAEVFYEQRQLSLAARYAPVFDDLPQSDK